MKQHIKTYESFLNESLNEMVRSFSSAEPADKFVGDIAAIQKSANDFLEFLKRERYTWSDAAFLYFPDFVWAGGKQQFGPSVGILVGSDTIVVRPIGTDKAMKIGDGLIANLIKSKKLEAYSLNFS